MAEGDRAEHGADHADREDGARRAVPRIEVPRADRDEDREHRRAEAAPRLLELLLCSSSAMGDGPIRDFG